MYKNITNNRNEAIQDKQNKSLKEKQDTQQFFKTMKITENKLRKGNEEIKYKNKMN
jgi:hypothetical protein